MKRIERIKSASEDKVKNPLNSSKSKFQYSFSRAERFYDKKSFSVTSIRFYDLPSTKSRRKTTFGYGNRTSFLANNNPPPNQYEAKNQYDESRKIKIHLGKGRKECKSNDVFSTNKNPGPGEYNPNLANVRYKNLEYSMGKKFKQQENVEETPGPIYKIESTLLDEKKVLSIYRKKNSIRMCPARSVLCRKTPEQSQKNINFQSDHDQKLITRKGWKQIGKGTGTIMGSAKRFPENKQSVDLPGPGHYQSFSEFIDIES